MPQMPNTGSAIGSSTMILAILLKDLQDQINTFFIMHIRLYHLTVTDKNIMLHSNVYVSIFVTLCSL